jgi:hypothetical protein
MVGLTCTWSGWWRSPSAQACRPGPLEVGSGTIIDTVIGGTGTYADATGTLSGTVRLEGSNDRPAGTSTVKLAGTIHYDP